MKVFLIVFLYFFTLIKTNELEFELEIKNIITKECEALSNQSKVLCENTIRKKFESQFHKTQTKTKYRVEAILFSSSGENNQTESTQKNDLFNFAMPINTCKNEDCEFCCLSTNRCGTRKQCENSKYYIKFVNWIFFGLIFTLFLALVIKCFQIDSYPDQQNSEKIENADLNELISMFGIIRNNRKKLIS